MLHSGLVLEQHMRSLHLLQQPYTYLQCDTCFNNLRECSSHIANQHHWCKVSCKHCDYRTVSKSRMCVHVWLHTKGMKCSRCERTFPSEVSLAMHEKRHCKQWEQFDCEKCDNLYSTATALRIHIQGKHRHGFVCDCCCKRFDTLYKWKGTIGNVTLHCTFCYFCVCFYSWLVKVNMKICTCLDIWQLY